MSTDCSFRLLFLKSICFADLYTKSEEAPVVQLLNHHKKEGWGLQLRHISLLFESIKRYGGLAGIVERAEGITFPVAVALRFPVEDALPFISGN